MANCERCCDNHAHAQLDMNGEAQELCLPCLIEVARAEQNRIAEWEFVVDELIMPEGVDWLLPEPVVLSL